jgi:hypothetical protein
MSSRASLVRAVPDMAVIRVTTGSTQRCEGVEEAGGGFGPSGRRRVLGRRVSRAGVHAGLNRGPTYLAHPSGDATVGRWPLLHTWSRPMPRIEDRLLKSIIYLYKSKEAAESGEPGGSGFLIGEVAATRLPLSFNNRV